MFWKIRTACGICTWAWLFKGFAVVSRTDKRGKGKVFYDDSQVQMPAAAIAIIRGRKFSCIQPMISSAGAGSQQRMATACKVRSMHTFSKDTACFHDVATEADAYIIVYYGING
jgi:hypothetical protein